MAQINITSDDTFFFQIDVNDKTGEMVIFCVGTKNKIDVEAQVKLNPEEGLKLVGRLQAIYLNIEG